jgi:hypothetical protein
MLTQNYKKIIEMTIIGIFFENDIATWKTKNTPQTALYRDLGSWELFFTQ